ncbi:MAG: bifunctional folylpolyglutamate synthase/dihydrofolate synthase [Rhodospirillaceae bacterium]|nr:bifunctional folylpolyglutamate synthase/dihydrofolate synthase [Rhodospirillaceae bacterium]
MIDVTLERLNRLYPKLIDLTLDRILILLDALDHPELCLPPVIHVAGTNGKGSTIAFLRAIAEAAGMRVHVYTSPHLVRFAERIRISGNIIDEKELNNILIYCEEKNDGLPITFFEITTAAAFYAFANRPADLCLIETGLGGRFDATNIVDNPAVTILTTISFDHKEFLGDTLDVIANNKLGILKPNVPCISASQDPKVQTIIIEKSEALNVPLFIENKNWRVESITDGFRFVMGNNMMILPTPALLGAHQMKNSGLAIAAAQMLTKIITPTPLTIATGLCQVEWSARLQLLKNGSLLELMPIGSELWLDGGHNPSAGQALALFIKENWMDRPLDVIVGMLNTKDSRNFLSPMAPLVRRMKGISILNELNSQTADQICILAQSEGLSATPSTDITTAIIDLTSYSNVGRILICGSLYLAGVVLSENERYC